MILLKLVSLFMLYRDFSTSPRHPGRPPYRTHAVVVMTLGWQLFTAQLEGGDLRSLEFPHFQKFFLCYECLYLSHGKFIEVVCDKKEEPPSLTTVYIYIYSVCVLLLWPVESRMIKPNIGWMNKKSQLTIRSSTNWDSQTIFFARCRPFSNPKA